MPYHSELKTWAITFTKRNSLSRALRTTRGPHHHFSPHSSLSSHPYSLSPSDLRRAAAGQQSSATGPRRWCGAAPSAELLRGGGALTHNSTDELPGGVAVAAPPPRRPLGGGVLARCSGGELPKGNCVDLPGASSSIAAQATFDFFIFVLQ
jgi:hypothetical protein